MPVLSTPEPNKIEPNKKIGRREGARMK